MPILYLVTYPLALSYLIASKWKLLILRNLLNGPQRYRDFPKTIIGISHKVLTQSLKSIVEYGLFIRTAYPEVPPRVEYSLSDLVNNSVASFIIAFFL